MTSRAATIGVYLIQNTVTGSFYVGSSAACELRMQRHYWNLRKGQHPLRELQAQWDAYGPGAMAFGIIITCFTLNAAIDYEQQMLNEHVGTDQCMNESRQAATPVSKYRRGKRSNSPSPRRSARMRS